MQEEMFEVIKERVPGNKRGRCGSGQRFENMAAGILQDSGWELEKQYVVGYRLGKRSKHRVDIKASKNTDDILVSCKYQDVPGTAPDKLPYEYMSLLHSVNTNGMTRGFIVLFGKVLQEANVFARHRIGELEPYMTISNKIVVCDFEEFTRLCIREELLIVK